MTQALVDYRDRKTAAYSEAANVANRGEVSVRHLIGGSEELFPVRLSSRLANSKVGTRRGLPVLDAGSNQRHPASGFL
jgi:hypothetical protein